MLDITSKTTKKITEASYLCMGNSFRYRAIIRIAYKKYEKMKYSLYKEEIFDDIKKISGISLRWYANNPLLSLKTKICSVFSRLM